MTHTARIVISSFVIALAATALVPGVSCAGKVTNYNMINRMEYAGFQGTITQVSSGGEFIVVDDVKVYIVEANVRGTIKKTSFHGKRSEEASSKDLKTGDNVYVYAGASTGDDVVAKDIYLLPSKLTKSGCKRFSGEKKLTPWR